MTPQEEYKVLKHRADLAENKRKKYMENYVNSYIDEGKVTYIASVTMYVRLHPDAQELSIDSWTELKNIKPGCPVNTPKDMDEATKMFEEQVRVVKMMRQATLALKYLVCN